MKYSKPTTSTANPTSRSAQRAVAARRATRAGCVPGPVEREMSRQKASTSPPSMRCCSSSPAKASLTSSAVGRVMRLAPDKEFGYVVLPVAIPAGVAPEDALRNQKDYQVVWQVLQALRSHDERLVAEINKIDINKTSSKVEVIGIARNRWRRPCQPRRENHHHNHPIRRHPTGATRPARVARCHLRPHRRKGDSNRRHMESWYSRHHLKKSPPPKKPDPHLTTPTKTPRQSHGSTSSPHRCGTTSTTASPATTPLGCCPSI